MTSHSYYKDRLGFDPNELQHEPGNHHNSGSGTGTNSMKRSSSRQTHHHHQSYHHATTTSSSAASPVARISVSPGGNGTLDYHQVQREQRDRELYANGHSSSSTHHYHHHQQHHPRHSHGLVEASPAAKKAKHSSTQAQPQGGYEDALTQFKDERDAIQKKTFTKWVNKHLKKANRRVVDLFEDLRDGHNLLSLLEVLSGEHLPREKGKMRFHMLQNAQMALDFLRFKNIKLVNIRAEDIVDGNPKLTLGLIWTIILHFQITLVRPSSSSYGLM
ncbi:hypothetical protein AWZ03_008286 [Drosophila navojoa]|uniref:Calponin-homology (CH) domain-containing protein n=1 Tax=Drosophila navojoa TaxID=7232 RepID=A0A484B8V8_DRONA|nr:hypothetical protein AWZ03_008286 [Drosophila navojoa]